MGFESFGVLLIQENYSRLSNDERLRKSSAIVVCLSFEFIDFL